MRSGQLGGRRSALLRLIQWESWPAWLLVAAICFNAALAIVNAHIAQMGRLHVVLVELLISGTAILLCLLRYRREMAPWLLLCGSVIGLGMILAIGNQAINPKLIRDALLIPIFVMLGMLYARGNIIKLIAAIQLVVTAFMIFEAVGVQTFGDVFGIAQYYLNTREMTAEQFWNPDSLLYVSAQRPDERFLLPGLGIHRLSSIFLEPVSLGNYCIIAMICICSFWSRMSGGYKIFFAATTGLILIGSDGRLALVTCLLLIPLSMVAQRLPRYVNILYLPLTIALAAIAVSLLNLTHGDDFPGRLAVSMRHLGSLDLSTLLGFNAAKSPRLMDSGISYLIATQSLIGAALMWTAISLGLQQRSTTARIFLHGTCAYIALNLLISYSLFSIKTAALLWFVYGFIRVEEAFSAQPAAVSAGDNSGTPDIAIAAHIPARSAARTVSLARVGQIVAIARSGALPAPVGQAIQLLVFSLQTRTAVASARREDFHRTKDGGYWLMAPKGAGRRRNIRIPLSGAAWAVVDEARALGGSSPWLFQQPTPDGKMSHITLEALTRALRRMPNMRPAWQEIRETFALYVPAEMGLSAEHAAAILSPHRRDGTPSENGDDRDARLILARWSAAVEEAARNAVEVNPNLHDMDWLASTMGQLLRRA